MNVNVAVVLAVGPVGPLPIVVSGAVVSTVNERGRRGGVGRARGVDRAHLERLRAVASGARSCGATCRPANAAVAPTRHWNVEPGSVDVNVNVGVGSFVSPVGPPVIVVFGGPASLTTNVRVVTGGLGNSALTARTENVYGPSARSVYGCALDL